MKVIISEPFLLLIIEIFGEKVCLITSESTKTYYLAAG